jgi:hypothetical protein
MLPTGSSDWFIIPALGGLVARPLDFTVKYLPVSEYYNIVFLFRSARQHSILIASFGEHKKSGMFLGTLQNGTALSLLRETSFVYFLNRKLYERYRINVSLHFFAVYP